MPMLLVCGPHLSTKDPDRGRSSGQEVGWFGGG